MTNETLTPPPRLRALLRASQWLWWSLLGLWLLVLALWGSLHFLIVPRIAEWRPWLQTQISAQLGVPVRIDAITAPSNGLLPSVALSGVHVLDAQGRDALYLPSVVATFSVRSLARLGLEQLAIEQPTLEVARSADGRLWVAGLALDANPQSGSAGSDWLLAQSEVVVRGGTVVWRDALAPGAGHGPAAASANTNLPPNTTPSAEAETEALTLREVNLVLRKKGRTHRLRVDATPPSALGARLQLMAEFKEPLLHPKRRDWHTWMGQAYVSLPQVDLAVLRQHLRPSTAWDLRTGQGALRAWVAVERGAVAGATADVALHDVTLHTPPPSTSQLAAPSTPQPASELTLRQVSGRVGVAVLPGGMEYSTQALAFDTADGLHWPGGNVRLQWFDGPAASAPAAGKPSPSNTATAAAHGELWADRLDLAALAEISRRLPLAPALHSTLGELAPKGLVEQLHARWQGALPQVASYSARGRVSGLALQPLAAQGLPGLRGLDVDFDLDNTHGSATLALRQGALLLPQVFAQGALDFERLQTTLRWQQADTGWRVQAQDLQFANADAQGQAQLQWTSNAGPGTLDLQGTLGRARLAALPRYLPLGMPLAVREYLGQALQGGTASNVQFKVQGDLAHFPFADPRQGTFRISAALEGATYAFAAPGKDGSPWPALERMNGQLLLEHDTLEIKNASAQLGASGPLWRGGLRVNPGQARIEHLSHQPELRVDVQASGPVSAALAVVNHSPLGGWTHKTLAGASGTGNADYRLQLQMPLNAMEQTTVQGSVAFNGNELQITPETPRLQRTRGTLTFTENTLGMAGMQARSLGGDVRLDGGLLLGGSAPAGSATSTAANRAPSVLRLQGSISGEGLRQAKELGALARLGQYANGSTSYTATLGLRSGALELSVASSLAGMALDLPAPLHKTAESTLPVRLEQSVLRSSLTSGARLQDQWRLELGRVASATYVRDISGPQAKVLRGAVGIGLPAGESAPMPTEGVAAQVQLAQVNVDAWTAVVSQLLNDATPAPAPAAPAAATNTAAESTAANYLPTTMVLRAQELLVQGRKLDQVLIGGGREGAVWRANVQAAQLNGYVEYRQPRGSTPGRLYARLARLYIGPSADQDVEELLDQQPSSIPALDVVVDDLELRGKKLGRLEIQAVNMARDNSGKEGAGKDGMREWRLNRLNLSVPEATLAASGSWIYTSHKSGKATNNTERSRTVLDVNLDLANSGELLQRLGMPGVIAKGKGKVQGQVAWQGSPLTLDYPSMTGGLHINVETGQFLKADPGIAKLLGVLSLQSLPRRLTLDFRDVFSEGFAFDFVRGDATIQQGVATTNNLQMKGVNAAVMMEGQADLAKETQALKVVVVPEINAGGASLIASTINPVVGLTTFLAQLILRQPLIEATTMEFFIDGSWTDPRVTKVERKK